ncbi:MAG: isoprenylcysteine carboxylmethyltransferase family protein [FCB group bacterium]|nr:isoprenylcysteine carboxylmethyltransferase family protein [FCB group bacterium]
MDIRQFFFKYRSYTPIPLALLIIYFSKPALPYLWIGLVFLIAGESIRVAAVRYAGGVTRTTNVGAPSLCTAGPYAHTRNPLYIGNMLMYTGIVLIAGAPNIWLMLAVTWAFFLTQYALIVALEEETLEKLFGEEYRVYRKNVPALIPRLKPWPNQDKRKPAALKKTLETERRTLQNVVLILFFILLRLQF